MAVRRGGITRHVTSHTVDHSFAAHRIERGHDRQAVEELLGQKQVSTIMIYTHVVGTAGTRVLSPIDSLYKRNGVLRGNRIASTSTRPRQAFDQRNWRCTDRD